MITTTIFGVIMFFRFILILTIFIGFAFVPNAHASEPSVLDKSETKGFYWYDRLKEAVEKEVEKDKPLPPPETPKDTATKEPKQVVINSEWLKENLPKLQMIAQDNPTNENLANYYYAQRLMLDIGSRFAERTNEFFMTEPVLSEDLRRPTMASSLLTKKDDIAAAQKKVVKGINDRFGVFFFYRSDCPYCHNQSHAMHLMQKNLGLEVLGISMDGLRLNAKNSDKYKHRVDRDLILSKKYNITITPTTMLVDYETGKAVPLAYGQTSYTDLVDKTLTVANALGAIHEDEFAETQSVNNIIALDNSEEGLVFDEKELEENPTALADELRRRLEVRTGVSTAGSKNEK